ncbi:MAG: glycosyltransferase [Nitrospirae bacterium]|nr:glycosyltransferase [Nitrospirota bacterium]
MSKHPIVSIVVPCLNRAQFLVPTIESIVQQDYPNVECVVVDGGSTDGTMDALKGYGDRIRWVSERDEGHADAINKGWKMSKGQILAWLNADDCYVVPDAVRRAVDFFKSHPETDVVYGDHALISKDGKVISDIIRHREWDLVHAVQYCDHIITQPACFMKRSVLEKVGWLDPEFRNCKDHELWLRIGLVGMIRYAPILLAYERITPGLTQQADVGTSIISLTGKFFSQPELPAPFRSTSFRRRARSNAYQTAGDYAWRGGHRKLFFEYLRKAVATDPLNGPYIAAKALRTILAISLPVGLKRALMRLMGITRRPDPRLNP